MREWWKRVKAAHFAYQTRAKGPYPFVMISICLAALASALVVSYMFVERLRAPLNLDPHSPLYAVLAWVVFGVAITFFMYGIAWTMASLLAAIGTFTREEARNFVVYGEYPERWLR